MSARPKFGRPVGDIFYYAAKMRTYLTTVFTETCFFKISLNSIFQSVLRPHSLCLSFSRLGFCDYFSQLRDACYVYRSLHSRWCEYLYYVRWKLRLSYWTSQFSDWHSCSSVIDIPSVQWLTFLQFSDWHARSPVIDIPVVQWLAFLQFCNWHSCSSVISSVCLGNDGAVPEIKAQLIP